MSDLYLTSDCFTNSGEVASLSEKENAVYRLPLPKSVHSRQLFKKSFNRSLRVADQIRRELARLVARELRDPRIKWVTIQSVELSTDYAYAKVYVTTLSDSIEEVVNALNLAAGYLRKLIYKKLTVHTIPTLRFFYDTKVMQAEKIAALIAAVRSSTPHIEKVVENCSNLKK